jgi:hypothetical protein
LSITIGTGLISMGVFLSRSGLDRYSVGAFVFGAVLVTIGWISGPKEAEK